MTPKNEYKVHFIKETFESGVSNGYLDQPVKLTDHEWDTLKEWWIESTKACFFKMLAGKNVAFRDDVK